LASETAPIRQCFHSAKTGSDPLVELESSMNPAVLPLRTSWTMSDTHLGLDPAAFGDVSWVTPRYIRYFCIADYADYFSFVSRPDIPFVVPYLDKGYPPIHSVQPSLDDHQSFSIPPFSIGDPPAYYLPAYPAGEPQMTSDFPAESRRSDISEAGNRELQQSDDQIPSAGMTDGVEIEWILGTRW